MVFQDEKKAVEQLSALLIDASKCLFMTTKYVYALSCKSFYCCDVKDIFKVVLNNICNADCLSAFHLDLDDPSCARLNSPEYKRVLRLIVYSFAIRLPALCQVSVGNDRMNERQISDIYDLIFKEGISNFDSILSEKFSDIRTSVRKGRAVAPYNAEWFRSYLYGCMPEFADINNRNLFFFGVVEVLFGLFYLCLEKEVASCIQTLCVSNSA